MSSSDFLLKTSREYSLYVCSSRGIANIEDGLKHSQRIALWLLRNKAEKIKTVALGGEMAATKLYVHGDQSANNAINLLAAPYKNNVPLIDGHGQFGSRIAPVDGIGAPRYTEVKRSKIAELLLYRDLDLVPLRDNYDGSNKEPIHFLPLIPLVLLNGVSGVAVGWSTEILPRSLKALIAATQDALNGKKLKTIPPHYEKYNINVVHNIDNKWSLVGKLNIVDSSTIHIAELPPGFDMEKYREFLIEKENNDEIVGFTDKSTDNIDITVKFKRGSIKDWTEDDAIKFLKITEKITERIVVIDWGQNTIKTYSNAEDVVTSFAQWRLGWYSKRFQKQILDTEYELAYWYVLKALFKAGFTKKLGLFADRVAIETEVRTIASKTKMTLDDSQMDRVVNLPTYRWTKNFEAEIDNKIGNMVNDVATYNTILSSPDKLKKVYLDELEELKKKL